MSEQQQLSRVVSTLEERVRELKSQLEAEKERCRLLMEYPYIKPSTSKGKMGDMTQLESQRQVSANTIRILLLEEQNADLRQQQVVMVMKEADPSSSHHQSAVRPCKTLGEGRICAMHLGSACFLMLASIPCRSLRQNCGRRTFSLVQQEKGLLTHQVPRATGRYRVHVPIRPTSQWGETHQEWLPRRDAPSRRALQGSKDGWGVW